jgi:hypothetical protein
MKLVRTIAMHTDHDFYGRPIEVTGVELYCDPDLSPELVEVLKRNQEKRLLSHVKRMPHRYWNELNKDKP